MGPLASGSPSLRASGWLRLALLVGCASVAGCSHEQAPGAATARSGSTDPAAEDYVGPALPHGRVVLHDAYGGAHLVDVEIAADDKSRERGLMWRKSLAEGTGMLFVFPHDEPHSFWMRNTLIPLDMAFITIDRKIVALVQNAEPQTLTNRGTAIPTRYVLELPGGWTEKLGVATGSTVELTLPVNLAVE